MSRTTVSRQTVVFDPVNHVVDIGELTKLGRFLGYDVYVTQTKVEGFRGSRIELELVAEQFTAQAAAHLAIIAAVALGKTGQQLLDEIQREMESMEFPLDRPIQDVMEIGGGPDHDGHNRGENP